MSTHRCHVGGIKPLLKLRPPPRNWIHVGGIKPLLKLRPSPRNWIQLLQDGSLWGEDPPNRGEMAMQSQAKDPAPPPCARQEELSIRTGWSQSVPPAPGALM